MTIGVPSTASLANQKPLSLGDATTKAAQAAPSNSPATTVTIAAKGGDITKNAQAVARSDHAQQIAKAAQQSEAASGGGLSSVLGWLTHHVEAPVESALGQVAKPVGQALSDVGSAVASNTPSPVKNFVSDASKALSVPLQTAQHQYRYLHDVEARHGMVAALGEGLGIAAGAAAGTLVAGPEGLALGAEGAAEIEGQLLYKTSWARTATGNKYRDPHTGDIVSIGRTVADELGLKGSKNYGTLSGVIDGVSDLLLTPLGHVGGVAGDARSAEGARGAIGKIWGGIGLNTPEDVERAFDQYHSVKTAFKQIADMDTAGDIGAKYPKLWPISDRLANASTATEVKDVFKEVVTNQKLATNIDTVPTQTFMRNNWQNIRDGIKNSEIPGANAPFVGPARVARRLTNIPGGFITPDTLKLETKVDFDSANNAPTIYKLVQYSQNESVAREAANQWVFAEPAQRRVLYKNVLMDTLGAQAHFAPVSDLGDEEDWEEMMDPRFRKFVLSKIERWTGGAVPGFDGEYGKDKFGAEIGKAYTPKLGGTLSTGILENHLESGSFPTFTEVKRMGKMMKGGHAYLGRADTWLYNHVTGKFLMPLMLLSGGYGERMALAEDMENLNRQGVIPMLKGAFYHASAKLGHQVDENDANAYIGYLHRMMTKLPTNEERAEFHAAQFRLTTGHGTTDPISAGHNTSKTYTKYDNASSMFREAAGKKVPRVMRQTKDFATYRPDQAEYQDAWRDWVREGKRSGWTQTAAKAYTAAVKKGASDEDAVTAAGKAAATHIRSEPDEVTDPFLKKRLYPTANPPAGMDPIDHWGMDVARNMRGMMGKDYNQDIGDALANGRMPSRAKMAQIDNPPEAVKGRVGVVDGSSSVRRIADVGFNRIINPMINALSRNPSFNAEAYRQWKLVKPLVDKGVIDYDEGVVRALGRATTKEIKFVHNVHTRTQWTETMRNWMPFAFAQEQAYKRAGRLLVEDPGAFRRYQLQINAVGNYMAKQQNKTGTTYFTIPGSGILGKQVPQIMARFGVPLKGVDTFGLGGSITSANVVFPLSEGFKPDTGPLATFAAKGMAAILPESIPALSKVVDQTTITSPIWKVLLPNTLLQRVVGVAEATKTTGFANSMMQAFQNLETQQNEAVQQWIKNGSKGKFPDIVPSPQASATSRQDFINKVRNQARIMYAMRALVGVTTPIDPHVTVTDFGLSDDLNAEIKKQGSVSKGITVFLQKNPEATPYTVAKSSTVRGETTKGEGLPEGEKAMTWLNNNKGLVQKYAQGSTWLMPQPKGTTYASAVYSEQVAQHLRTRDTPGQFLNQLYVSAGDQIYYAQEKKFEADLTAAGDTKTAKAKLYTEWTTYKESLAKASPLWADSFNSGQRTNIARDSINQLQEIRDSGKVPNNPQAQQVMTLLGQFNKAEQAYMAAGAQVKNYSEAQTQVKNAWYDYLTKLSKSHPNLAGVASAVFRYGLGKVPSPLTKG